MTVHGTCLLVTRSGHEENEAENCCANERRRCCNGRETFSAVTQTCRARERTGLSALIAAVVGDVLMSATARIHWSTVRIDDALRTSSATGHYIDTNARSKKIVSATVVDRIRADAGVAGERSDSEKIVRVAERCVTVTGTENITGRGNIYTTLRTSCSLAVSTVNVRCTRTR